MLIFWRGFLYANNRDYWEKELYIIKLFVLFFLFQASSKATSRTPGHYEGIGQPSEQSTIPPLQMTVRRLFHKFCKLVLEIGQKVYIFLFKFWPSSRIIVSKAQKTRYLAWKLNENCIPVFRESNQHTILCSSFM